MSRSPRPLPELRTPPERTPFAAERERTPGIGVDDGVLKGLVHRATPVKLARRGVWWSPGDAVTALGWVRSGLVRETLVVGDREIVLGFHGRGEIVGETGVLEALARGAAVRASTLEAHEESVVLSLSVAQLAEVVAQEPDVARLVSATCAERRRKLEERLASLVFRTARSRLAASLLELAGRFGVRDSRGVIVNVRLTHRDLAAFAGASRETASVALLDWRQAGLVQVESKRVILLDPPALAGIARDE